MWPFYGKELKELRQRFVVFELNFQANCKHAKWNLINKYSARNSLWDTFKCYTCGEIRDRSELPKDSIKCEDVRVCEKVK